MLFHLDAFFFIVRNAIIIGIYIVYVGVWFVAFENEEGVCRLCAQRSREAYFAVFVKSVLQFHALFDGRILHAAVIHCHRWVRNALDAAVGLGEVDRILEFSFDDGGHIRGSSVSLSAALQCLYLPRYRYRHAAVNDLLTYTVSDCCRRRCVVADVEVLVATVSLVVPAAGNLLGTGLGRC